MTPPEKFPASDAIETAATAWLARRDRTLTAAEQDAYLQWLREDPRHAAAQLQALSQAHFLEGH